MIKEFDILAAGGKKMRVREFVKLNIDYPGDLSELLFRLTPIDSSKEGTVKLPDIKLKDIHNNVLNLTKPSLTVSSLDNNPNYPPGCLMLNLSDNEYVEPMQDSGSSPIATLVTVPVVAGLRGLAVQYHVEDNINPVTPKTELAAKTWFEILKLVETTIAEDKAA